MTLAVVALALTVNVVAAWVSLSERLPARWGGFIPGGAGHMTRDFLWIGTAMAPPLPLMLLLGVVAVLRKWLWVAAIGAAGVVGYLGEPFTWDARGAKLALTVAGIALFGAMTVLAWRERA